MPLSLVVCRTCYLSATADRLHAGGNQIQARTAVSVAASKEPACRPVGITSQFPALCGSSMCMLAVTYSGAGSGTWASWSVSPLQPSLSALGLWQRWSAHEPYASGGKVSGSAAAIPLAGRGLGGGGGSEGPSLDCRAVRLLKVFPIRRACAFCCGWAGTLCTPNACCVCVEVESRTAELAAYIMHCSCAHSCTLYMYCTLDGVELLPSSAPGACSTCSGRCCNEEMNPGAPHWHS